MIRTHIITGFLGVGKTTAILHWLKHKPEHEKWAVLVNEFGEVGVDGAILASQGAVVREVPGGCLCCVSGLPFQMGLNWLIAREQPDVLLIEPTGLGHPRNILRTLQEPHYADRLRIGSSVCLLDPRHLANPRYTTHEHFLDQIHMADVLVANKTDLASDTDRAAFEALLAHSQPPKQAHYWVEQGQAPQAALMTVVEDSTKTKDASQAGEPSIRMAAMPTGLFSVTPTNTSQRANDNSSIPSSLAAQSVMAGLQEPLRDDEPVRRLTNAGQGFYSLGWILAGDGCYSLNAVRNWLLGLNIERAKALMNTDQGAMVLNMREGVISEMPTRALDESRLEILSEHPFDAEQLEKELLACRLPPSVPNA